MADTAPITFEDLQREAEADYCGCTFLTRAGVTVHLRSLVMLDKTARHAAEAIMKTIDDKPSSDSISQLDAQEAKARDLLKLVSNDPKAMAAEMGDWSLGVLLKVIEKWMGDTQAPEASGSAS